MDLQRIRNRREFRMAFFRYYYRSFGTIQKSLFGLYVQQYIDVFCYPQPLRPRAIPGYWIRDMLQSDSTVRWNNCMRMQKSTFLALRDWCLEHTTLRPPAVLHHNAVSIEEKLAIFIYIVSIGASNRQPQEFFARGPRAITTHFNSVLRALLKLHQHVVQLPKPTRPLDRRIAFDRKYYPYFKDCIGALDGTHIPAFVSAEDAPAYRNRKGSLSQNVLGVCTFDLQFCFVFPGWEGSAHDGLVLDSAEEKGNFVCLPGKYYLADAGYANTKHYLTPYRGVRYHLREQALANLRPATKEELFNLRHSSLRNVVERIFGVLKRRFRWLNLAPEYSLDVQIRIVFVLTALHNFIRSWESEDIFAEAEYAEERAREADLGEQSNGDNNEVSHINDSQEMEEFRDKLAEAMWADYQTELSRRRLI